MLGRKAEFMREERLDSERTGWRGMNTCCTACGRRCPQEGDETVVRDSEMTTLAGLNGSGVLTPILGDVEKLREDHGVSVVPPDYYHFRSGWDAAFLPTLHPSIPSFLDYRGFCDAPSLEWSTHLLPSLISGRNCCQNGGGG